MLPSRYLQGPTSGPVGGWRRSGGQPHLPSAEVEGRPVSTWATQSIGWRCSAPGIVSSGIALDD